MLLVLRKVRKFMKKMTRLKDNLLNASTGLKCSDLVNTALTISFLNVRSIIGKLPDIEADISLTNASILGFCETWLSPSQDSPQVRDSHIVLMCDRTIDNNHGGVMLSVPQSMSPRNVIKINRNGIEILVTTLLLSNNRNVQIALLYRSPNVSVEYLITVLINMFNNIDSTLPTLLMGDFNEDMSEYSAQSAQIVRLLRFMSDNGYDQLIKTPTTDRGTLIDHIYCNSNSGNIVTEVTDCYYSDHDIVFCSLRDLLDKDTHN